MQLDPSRANSGGNACTHWKSGNCEAGSHSSDILLHLLTTNVCLTSVVNGLGRDVSQYDVLFDVCIFRMEVKAENQHWLWLFIHVCRKRTPLHGAWLEPENGCYIHRYGAEMPVAAWAAAGCGWEQRSRANGRYGRATSIVWRWLHSTENSWPQEKFICTWHFKNEAIQGASHKTLKYNDRGKRKTFKT